jgi:hypothetical protein
MTLKPGNAGGGKGPQFKTDAISGEGPGDWATYRLRECSETAEGATFSKAATVPWNFVSDESAATGTLRLAPRFFPI